MTLLTISGPGQNVGLQHYFFNVTFSLFDIVVAVVVIALAVVNTASGGGGGANWGGGGGVKGVAPGAVPGVLGAEDTATNVKC